MEMSLNDYRKEIKLDEKFVPNVGDFSLDDLLYILSEEAVGRLVLERIKATERKYSQREIIKALLTARPAGNVSEALTAGIDTMLQRELEERFIVDGQDLERVGGKHRNDRFISIWNGDITTLKIDAIVNAANSQMEGCFIPFHNCIDNAIHNGAGIMLREDCARIMKIQGRLEETADAKITRGYNLPSKYVIHTVGPIVSQGILTERDRVELARSYEACLELAKESKLVRSIAFCSISTGVFGFPFKEAARIAITTVRRWLERNPDTIEHIVFNTFGEDATKTYERLIMELV